MEQDDVPDKKRKERVLDEGALDLDDEQAAFELVDVPECLPDDLYLLFKYQFVHSPPIL
jgi:hypothetical protein